MPDAVLSITCTMINCIVRMIAITSLTLLTCAISVGQRNGESTVASLAARPAEADAKPVARAAASGLLQHMTHTRRVTVHGMLW